MVKFWNQLPTIQYVHARRHRLVHRIRGSWWALGFVRHSRLSTRLSRRVWRPRRCATAVWPAHKLRDNDWVRRFMWKCTRRVWVCVWSVRVYGKLWRLFPHWSQKQVVERTGVLGVVSGLNVSNNCLQADNLELRRDVCRVFSSQIYCMFFFNQVVW